MGNTGGCDSIPVRGGNLSLFRWAKSVRLPGKFHSKIIIMQSMVQFVRQPNVTTAWQNIHSLLRLMMRDLYTRADSF
jgi:hypothetical protein